MILRNYKSDDYEAVIQNLQVEDMFDETWDGKSNFDSLVNENPTNILVAEINGEVVGSVLIDQFGQDVAFIYRLVVKEQYRGQGVANELLEKVYKVLRERGTKEVALFANSDDERLVDYYTKRGFARGNHTYRAMWRSI